jgi:hypothetical protein
VTILTAYSLSLVEREGATWQAECVPYTALGDTPGEAVERLLAHIHGQGVYRKAVKTVMASLDRHAAKPVTRRHDVLYGTHAVRMRNGRFISEMG